MYSVAARLSLRVQFIYILWQWRDLNRIMRLAKYNHRNSSAICCSGQTIIHLPNFLHLFQSRSAFVIDVHFLLKTIIMLHWTLVIFLVHRLASIRLERNQDENDIYLFAYFLANQIPIAHGWRSFQYESNFVALFLFAVFLAPLKTFQQSLRPRKLKMSFLQIPAEGLFNGQNLIFVHFLCNETFSMLCNITYINNKI